MPEVLTLYGLWADNSFKDESSEPSVLDEAVGCIGDKLRGLGFRVF